MTAKERKREPTEASTTTESSTTTTQTHTAIRASMVSSSASVEVDDPVSFAKDPSVQEAFTATYADLGGVGFSQVDVSITLTLRRLHDGRKLAGAVTVHVQITIVSSSAEPDAASDVSSSLGVVTSESLGAAASSELQAKGVSAQVQVQSVEAPTITELALTATTMTTTLR